MANVTVNNTSYSGVDEVRLRITDGGGEEQSFYSAEDATIVASDLPSGKIGYNADGKVTGTVQERTSSDLTVSGRTVTAPAGLYRTNASTSIAEGAAGTPSASKGNVSNHSVSITPSVTNTTGYITGGTKTGSAVTVSASELVSGSQTLTENDTYDVSDLAEVVVDVPTGSDPVINPLSVTENGTYTAPSGVDGYSPVTVNVQVGGGGVNHFSKSITVASDLSGGAMLELVPNAELISEGITVSGKKIQDIWNNFIILFRRINAVEGTQEYVWGITMSDSIATTSSSANNALRRYAIVHDSSASSVNVLHDRGDIAESGIFISSALSRGIFVNAGSGYTIKAGSYEVHILYWGAITA